MNTVILVIQMRKRVTRRLFVYVPPDEYFFPLGNPMWKSGIFQKKIIVGPFFTIFSMRQCLDKRRVVVGNPPVSSEKNHWIQQRINTGYRTDLAGLCLAPRQSRICWSWLAVCRFFNFFNNALLHFFRNFWPSSQMYHLK